MTNSELYERARKVMPGGVSSPVRAFRAVECEPIVVERALGSKVWDVEGNEYIDYINSWGPLILGHAHPKVVKAVQEQAKRGLSYGLTNQYEVYLAELVVDLVPSIESVRFVSSGTEAAMSAIRLARGYTGRKYVVKFDGCYHGHYDSLLVKGGSGVATFGIPGTAGVPEEVANLTIVLPYNSTKSVEETFEKYGEDIACVIVEPIAGNMGVVVPDTEFLKSLSEIAKKYGSLLIFDEVITGFRASLGGAQELFNIVPDITCLGKVLGGGMPLGAYGGKREIMQMVSPSGPIYQAGTLSGNPLSMVAGMVTLKELIELNPYENIDKMTSKLTYGISEILKEKGVPHTINCITSMFTVFFSEEKVKDFERAKKSDVKMFSRFFKALLGHNIFIPPSQFEAWFLSAAHTQEDVENTLERISKAVKSF
ncbi:MAG: glutamate-1-semialdehyde 2,1-aminomutase [Aquificaceae bacterium]